MTERPTIGRTAAAVRALWHLTQVEAREARKAHRRTCKGQGEAASYRETPALTRAIALTTAAGKLLASWELLTSDRATDYDCPGWVHVVNRVDGAYGAMVAFGTAEQVKSAKVAADVVAAFVAPFRAAAQAERGL